jgi:hypothetical protein
MLRRLCAELLDRADYLLAPARLIEIGKKAETPCCLVD